MNIPGAKKVTLQQQRQACDNVNNRLEDANRALIDNMHNYLSELLSVTYSYLATLVESNTCDQPIYNVMPMIVDAIMRYNNVYFDNVVLYVTEKRTLFEPLWYNIEQYDDHRLLVLFYDRSFYEEFVTTTIGSCVYWAHGNLNFDAYYQEYEHPIVLTQSNTPLLKAIIACDHLALHVLHQLYDDETRNATRSRVQLSTDDIHEVWSNDNAPHVGVTLHSFFKLTVVQNSDLLSSSNSTLT